MKILLAYDGSDSANAAVDDLRHAGLPDNSQVRIVSITEHWMPPPSSLDLVAGHQPDTEAFIQARDAAQALRTGFPHWDVTPQSQIGSPGSVILEYAEHWNPDLIVVGSHGRGSIGRFFLGSVSQKIVTSAHCSVRVARGRLEEPDTPLRLIIGIDGSECATAAVDSVAARHWPSSTEVRLVNASWDFPPIGNGDVSIAFSNWMTETRERLDNKLKEATEKLTAQGLLVTTVSKREDPKQLLCDEAEGWGADCIFVGAQGISKIERWLLGSVSAAVAARAHCSVEIVRSQA